MWTPDALRSEARPASGTLWRVVEAQAQCSTMRITANLDDQRLLEQEIEAVKPRLPPGTDHLHPLLRTPFRYRPYDQGSRFRRKDQAEGAFYGSEAAEAAIAEMAFHRARFFAEAPGMDLPDCALDVTAFAVPYQGMTLDLTIPPLNMDTHHWTDPREYGACQALADAAREAGVQAIRYRSVRDPHGRANVALLDWRAFQVSDPQQHQTWHLLVRPDRIDAFREFPRLALTFGRDAIGLTPRP